MSYSVVVRSSVVLFGVLLSVRALAAPAAAGEQVCRDELRPGSRIATRLCVSASELATASDKRKALDRAGITASSPFPAQIVATVPHAASPYGPISR